MSFNYRGLILGLWKTSTNNGVTVRKFPKMLSTLQLNIDKSGLLITQMLAYKRDLHKINQITIEQSYSLLSV